MTRRELVSALFYGITAALVTLVLLAWDTARADEKQWSLSGSISLIRPTECLATPPHGSTVDCSQWWHLGVHEGQTVESWRCAWWASTGGNVDVALISRTTSGGLSTMGSMTVTSTGSWGVNWLQGPYNRTPDADGLTYWGVRIDNRPLFGLGRIACVIVFGD